MNSGSQNSPYPAPQTMIIVTFCADYYPANSQRNPAKLLETEFGLRKKWKRLLKEV